MNISSIVLQIVPERLDEARAALAAMPGMEIVAFDGGGKLALTMECDDTRAASDGYTALHQIPGVYSVALVYQYSDDKQEEHEESA